MNYRSSIHYAAAKAVEYLKQGIGLSKRECKKQYGGKSPYIHNWKTLYRYTGEFNNFIDTVLTPSNIKTINKITTEHTKEHFKNLVEKRYSIKTINSNASALNKFFYVFSRDDLITYIDSERNIWKYQAVPSSPTNPFDNPIKVINIMKYPYWAGAMIQYLTGARVSDIRKVYEWLIENPDAEYIVIRKSKGGRSRKIDYSERKEQFIAIKAAVKTLKEYFDINGVDWVKFFKEYTREVRRAAVKCEEIYCGPHAFRANYAETRYETLTKKYLSDQPPNQTEEEIKKDKEKEKAVFKTITEELGHSRISMAKYYIPKFRSD
jgi:hypothetical protein